MDGKNGAHGTNGSSSNLAPSARLPVAPGRFAPAHTELAETSGQSGAQLARVDGCAACHGDIAAQWQTSAHAFASFNNPVYRVTIDRFRRDVGRPASRFCAGCHDVALLVDGAMDGEIAPADPRAHAGITCRMCHGIAEVRPDGNGSFTLDQSPIPIPRPDDRASIARHRQAASVRSLGSRLCLSCHRSFLGPDTGNDHHLRGMDDYSAWQGSAHAGGGLGRIDEAVPRRDCVACHMPKEPASRGKVAARRGAVSSHRFLGGHTWLAAMRGDAAGVERARASLQSIASIDIAAALSEPPLASAGPSPSGIERTLPADGAPVHPGGRISLDVVVRNLQVGHRFPGGVRDAQDTWIEVTIRDARGALLAGSGLSHESDPNDVDAHVLRALVADERGDVLGERETHLFRALVVDHTIAPRDAAVVRYAFDVPGSVRQPLRVDARLRHRTRNLALARLACTDSRGAPGRAFARGSRRAGKGGLDPCATQPITEIAAARVWIGRGPIPGKGRAPGPAPAWRRLYEHGMAWLHAVQEHLDEARPSLLRALELAGATPDGRRQKAMILSALGALAGRQGRTAEALQWLDRAAALAPGHPAIDALRGAALARVWRWEEAEAPLRSAARAAPSNRQAWIDLAIALGSLGKHDAALDAAHRGLAQWPRTGALLRVQALALRALGGVGAAAALDAYDRFRKPDRATDIRFACAARDPVCARERQPVHVHILRAPLGQKSN